MLTAGDEFPIHQTPEPVALVADRNFYDRFFYNGYSPDGRLFFAAAMGIYPALDVIDAAFCVVLDGVQHNLRASGRLGGDRMRLAVGPIAITIDVPLERITLTVAANDASPLAARLAFTGRHFPLEEPRFTRRAGMRPWMDLTRMTQNGRWSGWIDIAGTRHPVDAGCEGTRDRSWGIRPVGASDAQPAPAAPQFFWAWTPCNFGDRSAYFHTNDDAAGVPWNRRAVLWPDGAARGGGTEYGAPDVAIVWRPGTRRIARLTVTLDAGTRLVLTPGAGTFLMSGLGYTHPAWGHGMDHGELEVAYDSIDTSGALDADPAAMHVQELADAVLEHRGETHRGRGVVEQLFIGPHAPSGLAGLLDPA